MFWYNATIRQSLFFKIFKRFLPCSRSYLRFFFIFFSIKISISFTSILMFFVFFFRKVSLPFKNLIKDFFAFLVISCQHFYIWEKKIIQICLISYFICFKKLTLPYELRKLYGLRIFYKLYKSYKFYEFYI